MTGEPAAAGPREMQISVGLTIYIEGLLFIRTGGKKHATLRVAKPLVLKEWRAWCIERYELLPKTMKEAERALDGQT